MAPRRFTHRVAVVVLPPAADDPDRQVLLELLGCPRLPDDELRRRAAGVNWERTLAFAGKALHPFIDWSVRQRGVTTPPPVGRTLGAARRAAALIGAQRRLVIRRACEALDEARIPFVLLKGFALAYQVYPSPDTRPMSDVDIWVRDQFARAAEVLRPLGWRMPWWRHAHARFGVENLEMGLRLDEGAQMIELHRDPHSLSATIPAALDGIWERREPGDLGGFQAPVLTPEDTLVHLCVHLAEHHRFVAALPRLVDVSLVLAAFGSRIPWATFADRCRTLGVAGWVATTLGTAREMLGAPVPEGALEAFAIPGLDRLCEVAARQVWLNDEIVAHPRSLRAASSAAARARLLLERLRDLVAAREPDDLDKGGRQLRLLHRIRFAAQVRLPGFLRAGWRDFQRGKAGDRRRLRDENQALLDAMRARPSRSPASPEARQVPLPSSR